MADDLKALRQAIDQFPVAVTAKLRAVAWRASRTVMELAKARVPVDSGYTKENIHILEQPEKKQFLVIPGTDRPRVRIALHKSSRTGRTHTQKVSLNMLPNWLEYGTVYMRARPFMRPAADAVDAVYKREMLDAATKAADEAFR